jgi:hypothetical protein
MITDLLSTDGFIIYNKKLARTIGTNPAILLGYLCSEYNFYSNNERLDNGMFFCTREKIKYNTGLTETEQRTAIKKLKESGIIETELKGMPSKTYYKINESNIFSVLSSEESSQQDLRNPHNKTLENLTTRPKESSQQDLRNPHTNNNINNNLKQNTKDNIDTKIESIEKKCLEYDLEDEVIELLSRFFRNLLEDNRLVTEDKVKAVLAKLAKVDKKTQLNAVQLSLDMGYTNVNPDWLRKDNGNCKKDPSIYWEGGTHKTEEDRRAYLEKLLNDPNTTVF